MAEESKKLVIVIGLLLILLIVAICINFSGSKSVSKDLNKSDDITSPFVLYESQASWMEVAGGGYTHTIVLSNGDGNHIDAVSVGCNITPFKLSDANVKIIQSIIITHKLYDTNCLTIGGTDYYVKYTLGNGVNEWYINKESFDNWISNECKVYFNQIGQIISDEVLNQQSKKYYSSECS